MRKPASYTGEDVIEIHCHGNPIIIQSILSEVIKAGARLAEPGEFTRRAFLNNRMDLSQAEAVIDIINARTEEGAALAMSHLGGTFRKRTDSFREAIEEILSEIEVSLDFSDEVDEQPKSKYLLDRIQSVTQNINELLSTYDEGRAYRQGANIVIAGRSNVGKSSLLNRLLGEKRAIVTPVPGTTRDFIDEYINIEGIPVKLTDTAGIRNTCDAIEKEGIDLVWERVSRADIVLLVFDGSEKITPEDREIVEKVGSKKIITVINKTDLGHHLDESELKSFLPENDYLWISAKFGEGIPELKQAIRAGLTGGSTIGSRDLILTNLRHKLALESTAYFLGQAAYGIVTDRYPETVAFDLRDALDSLEEISGKTTTEDILNRIFSNFCIGK
jgi:tRNA modification GTPase